MSRVLPATIGVVRTGGLAAAAIRVATRSRDNHVVVADGAGGCFEAVPRRGVRHVVDVPYDLVVWLDRLTASLQPNQPALILGYCAAAAADDVGYNWPAIEVFAARTLAPWLPNGAVDRWADRRPAQLCSELAVNAYRAAGLDLFPGRLAASVSPGDLADAAFEKGWNS